MSRPSSGWKAPIFPSAARSDALPMLQRWRVDVVAHGPSLHDDDSYFLMRSYASLDDRTRSQDAFFGSAERSEGPRDALLSSFDRYSTAVIRLDEATIANLQAHDVNVRVLGDVALVHARTTFTTEDGRPGASRYTDVWARRNGRWVAVAAQVTRH